MASSASLIIAFHTGSQSDNLSEIAFLTREAHSAIQRSDHEVACKAHNKVIELYKRM